MGKNRGSDRVKIETAERLSSALNQAAATVSGGSELEGSVSELVVFLESLLGILREFKSREQVRDRLLDFDEPPPAAARLIEGTLRYAPRLLKGWFVAKTKTYTLSQKEPMGRPDAIAPERFKAICDEVSAWDRKGRSQADSKRLVASKYGVSVKTIHRIWLERANHPQDGVTILEAQTYAASLSE
jgi:hypothetical protein